MFVKMSLLRFRVKHLLEICEGVDDLRCFKHLKKIPLCLQIYMKAYLAKIAWADHYHFLG